MSPPVEKTPRKCYSHAMLILDALKPLTAAFFPPVCDACGAGLSTGPTLGPCASCRTRIQTFEPPHCGGCGRTVTSAGQRCISCEDRSIHQDRTLACMSYGPEARRLMHAYKFGRRRALTAYFAQQALAVLDRHAGQETFEAVLPVPSGAARDYRRGYAPAAEIAASIARTLGLPYLGRSLARLDGGRPQSLLRRAQRLSSATRRFTATTREPLVGRCLLLVDDILTTGQTVSDCARALKEGGARRVVALALTRGALRS